MNTDGKRFEDQAALEAVKRYWTDNPVHSVEFSMDGGLKEYLQRIDALRWADNERWARKRFYELTGGPQTRVLDAGCGIGVLSRFYAQKGFRVHALDISDSAVDITKKGFDIFGYAETSVTKGSVERLPYRDRSFDYIVSNGVIHHTPDTEAAVREFHRVLKPGGLASVAVYYKNILLRPPLWPLVRRLLPVLISKSKGREEMLCARRPEDLVKVYDGNQTPIAKVYSKRQADRLFQDFDILASSPHYFPARFLKGFRTGGSVHKILDRTCGVLIYYLLRKPEA